MAMAKRCNDGKLLRPFDPIDFASCSLRTCDLVPLHLHAARFLRRSSINRHQQHQPTEPMSASCDVCGRGFG